MPRFAANLTMLYTEVPFLERFALAARDGFAAVEFLFPYAHRPEEIRQRLDATGLTLVLHNLPAGNWDAGERGIACLPDRTLEFRDGVAQAVEYARALGVGQLNCLAGKAPPDMSEARLRHTFVENLGYAAAALERADLRLLIEPVNTFDIPGFYLSGTRQAIAILDEVDSPHALLQYDIYHAQRMEGELAATCRRYLPRIGHIQCADNPGRHEPGTGEINYSYLFAEIDRMGYTGWIGCEYKPATSASAGLEWLAAQSTRSRSTS